VSIWSTNWGIDATDHDETCAVYVLATDGGEAPSGRTMYTDAGTFWYDPSRPCTCRCGPVRYEDGSVLPTPESPRAGSASLCEVSGFIERDGQALCGPDGECDPPKADCCSRAYPYLRLWVTDDAPPDTYFGSVVVLDVDQARGMRDYLTGWLDRAGEPS
jgi:hypothetical protein